MSAFLLVVSAVVISLSITPSPGQENTDDEGLVQEFRNLFSDFLLNKDQDRAVKRIRDTSKVNHRHSGGAKLKADVIREDKPVAEEHTNDRPRLSPLYNCSRFEADSRLCINVLQLGTTLTIGVHVDGATEKSPLVHWYRVFTVRGVTGEGEEEKFSFMKFTKENLPWNVNIGGENTELRISPVTETDFSYNFFLATLDKDRPQGNVQGTHSRGHTQLLMFSIEPISIDMGPLYHGEEITISVRSHMELPPHSVRYEWARVDKNFQVSHNLPSNMRLSRDGSALVIKEHRDNYGGDLILTCAAFSNKNYTLARRNFLLRRINDANPHIKARSKFVLIRKRRFLDDFYVPVESDRKKNAYILLSKSKRDTLSPPSPPWDANWLTTDLNTIDDQENPQPVEFTEISNFEEQYNRNPPTTTIDNSEFSILDKPQETVLNFYGKSSGDEEGFAGPFPEETEETDMKLQRYGSSDRRPFSGTAEGRPKQTPTDELAIEKETGFIDRKEKEEPSPSFFEKRPPPEGKRPSSAIEDGRSKYKNSFDEMAMDGETGIISDTDEEKSPLAFENRPLNSPYSTMRIVSEERPTFEDRESMLIAECERHQDCGMNSVCFRIEGSKRFCRCRPHYRGNGLFCWLL